MVVLETKSKLLRGSTLKCVCRWTGKWSSHSVSAPSSPSKCEPLAASLTYLSQHLKSIQVLSLCCPFVAAPFVTRLLLTFLFSCPFALHCSPFWILFCCSPHSPTILPPLFDSIFLHWVLVTVKQARRADHGKPNPESSSSPGGEEAMRSRSSADVTGSCSLLVYVVCLFIRLPAGSVFVFVFQPNLWGQMAAHPEPGYPLFTQRCSGGICLFYISSSWPSFVKCLQSLR